MEWNEKKRKLSVGAILVGVGAIAVTTVVMAAGGGPGGGGGMGGPGGGGMAAAEKSASIITVKLAAPTIGSLTRNTEFIGKIEAADAISVYPETNGKISKLYYEQGDYVEAGDLLMTLDTSDLEFSMQKAEASYASAIASYESSVASANKTLGSDYTSKIISAENSLEQSENSYRSARLKYKQDVDSEDDNIDRLMEIKDNAETALDDALAAYNDARKNSSDADFIEEKRQEYVNARDIYNNAANAYSEALGDYDDETSALATTKNNAYKSLVQAQEQLELTMGDAYTEQKAVIEAQLKSAKLSLEASQLNLEEAQRNLDKASVYAPVSGKIQTCDAKEYSMASTNSAAFTILNDDTVQLTFNASSDGASALNVGDTLTVSRGGDTYEATITEIETEADANSGLFPIKASLPEGANLLPGVTVKVSAATAKAENALLVPIDNVYYDGDQPYVFTYEDGKAVRKDLVTGMSDESTIVAEEGLQPSSLIITTWHPDLADGADVLLAEGQDEVISAAANAGELPAKTESTEGKTETTAAKNTKKSSSEAEDKDTDKDDGESQDQEEDRSELLYNALEEEDDFGFELPEEPTYPDVPYTKDLSAPVMGKSSAASDAMAKSVADNSEGGMLNKK